jgi:hypothetical protein
MGMRKLIIRLEEAKGSGSSVDIQELNSAFKQFEKLIGQEFGNYGPDEDDEDAQADFQIATDALVRLGEIVNLYKKGESPKKISALVKEFYSSGEADTVSMYVDIKKILPK